MSVTHIRSPLHFPVPSKQNRECVLVPFESMVADLIRGFRRKVSQKPPTKSTSNPRVGSARQSLRRRQLHVANGRSMGYEPIHHEATAGHLQPTRVLPMETLGPWSRLS